MSKRNISYVSHEEPDFIKKFKQKIGYKEGPTIDSKRAELEQDDSDSDEPEDERPTVVVLKKGHLTAEEAEVHMKNQGESVEDEDEAPGGKIMFKKPKKKDEQKSDLNVSSSNKTEKTKELDKKPEKDRQKVKKVKNTKLLSFNEDEEEEDDG